MLRVALVGAGIMGSNHARVAMQVPTVQVSVVVDPDERRGRALASATGARYTSDLDDIDDVDAAIVATPTRTHADIACPLLAAGLDVLIEKPLAADIDAARSIISAAEKAGRLIQVGHVERFNPVILALDTLLTDPVHLDFRRISPYSARVTSGVVLDLMIHDLDLALAFGGPVDSVLAQSQKVREDSIGEDVATALLRFATGVTAVVTASRVSQEKIRHITITQRETSIALDLVRQDVAIHRLEHAEFVTDEGARYRQRSLVEIPYLEARGEPLALQLTDFVNAVQQRRPPRVRGEDALAALELTYRVLQKADA